LPQARKKARKTSKVQIQMPRRIQESIFLLSILIGVYLLACISSYDPLDPGYFNKTATDVVNNTGRIWGAWLADFFLFLSGYVAYLVPIIVVFVGWSAYSEAKPVPLLMDRGARALEWVARISGLILLVLSSTGLAHMHLHPAAGTMPAGGGGIFGRLVADPLLSQTGALGSTLSLLALLLVGITLFTGLSWFYVMDLIGQGTLASIAWVAKSIADLRDWFAGRRAKAKREEVRKADSVRQKTKPVTRIEPQLSTVKNTRSERVAKEKQQNLFANLPADALPPLKLLDEPGDQQEGYSKQALEALSRQVELKLADFGVRVDVVAVHPGPVITRFELQPEAGVKSSQISNLAKDLARGLSIVSVRVVEVIPGKSTIGLEIPNTIRHTVFLSEILRSEVYDASASPLTLALGKSIAGRPQVADLARMPHLLVAGTTGSGKSVALNAMILSLLYKSTPEEVRLVLVDPKMLELSIYEGIPHLLTPVVTDMKEAANALRWCVAEMERRYKLMAALGVRNLSGFNRKVRDAAKKGQPLLDPLFLQTEDNIDETASELETLPFIVVIIDELADMMMIVGKKVDQLIARLAQKARASGIHLILATQRPSVDVITGLIKANIPTRIAFQVSSRIDSRTILDQMGAEQLLGHGDMLYLPPGTALPERIHGAFVDDHEVHTVVEFIKRTGAPNYQEDVLGDTQLTADGKAINDMGFMEDVSGSGELDPLYDQAVAFVTETRKASISSVQRKLRVGYNRAARIIEEMEAAGVVSQPEHNGAREVLAPKPPRN
jgi:S-DNA-T family DNA segregation ATPase FtsK/SpoIIIE